jgi:hypothetical protein
MSEHKPEVFDGTRINLYGWTTYPYPEALYAQPEVKSRAEAVKLLTKYADAVGLSLVRVERDLSRRWIGRLGVN